MSDITPEQIAFLKNVAQHKMTILKDDGVYRHVRFRRPDSSCFRFDLHTWPGALCYTGDMGTYVFERTHDMFDFFATDQKDGKNPEKIYINLGYWAEKLIAVDGNRNGGKVKEFDESKFRRVVNEYRVGWMRDMKDRGYDAEQRKELWDAVDDEVFSHLESGGDRATHAAYEFHHTIDYRGDNKRAYYFQDFFEHDFTEYTHSIVWCMYAVSWGVRRYQDLKKMEVTA